MIGLKNNNKKYIQSFRKVQNKSVASLPTKKKIYILWLWIIYFKIFVRSEMIVWYLSNMAKGLKANSITTLVSHGIFLSVVNKILCSDGLKLSIRPFHVV